MKIAPELLDLSGIDHLLNRLSSMLVLFLLAVVAAFEDLLVGHVASDT